jgi:ATP-dependent DNA helicase PIF1
MEIHYNILTSTEKIVLVVASSGVASLLLPGGRTTHSRFKIPCDLDETAIYDIKRGTMLAELIEAASLVIWDEAFMTHRAAFEALDHTLRDLMSTNSHKAMTIPFGGKVVVFRRGSSSDLTSNRRWHSHTDYQCCNY